MSSCPCWIPAVISLVTLIPYTLLLLALYITLSRKIAQHSCGMQTSRDHPSPHPTSASAPGGDRGQQQPRAQQLRPPPNQHTEQKPSPAYAGSSETSSDTSEDSDSPSCPQGPGSGGNIHYTSLVFPGKGPEPGSAQDYEIVKTGMDYVNVDPKKRKTHFWPFPSPRASKGVEYTEVKP